jgi:hypothetical protein
VPLAAGTILKLRFATRWTARIDDRTDARIPDGAVAGSATAAFLQPTRRTGPFKYTPGFLYILALFIVGRFDFADPTAVLIRWGEYHLSWVEVLMVGAA